MRKFASVSLLLSLFLSSAIISRAQSRPRRVGDSTGAQTEPQPTAQPSNQKRPVLQTGTTITGSQNPSTQNKQTPQQAGYDPEEVGEGDVVRVNTTLVSIPVSVMDRSGRYVPNLRKEDFRIYEDGAEQEVAYFASVEKPFTVALVLDTSASTQFRLEEIQDAAIAFINQLRPEDKVIVVSFDEEVRVLAEATSDRYALRDAVRRTRTGGNTRLYDAMDLVINERLNRVSGRKAVVLFTDGVDTASRRGTYQGNMRDAEELDALIYPVQYDTSDNMSAGYPGGGGGGYPSGGPQWPSPMPRSKTGILIDILGGVLGGGNSRGGYGGGGGGGRGGVIYRRGGGGGPNTPEAYRKADAYLNDLAYKTGARLYRADTTRDLSQSFANIAEELRRQYSLGYYPKTQAQSGQRRQIKVRVMRPDLVVRARDSYIAGANGQDASAQNGGQQQSKPELRKRQLADMR